MKRYNFFSIIITLCFLFSCSERDELETENNFNVLEQGVSIEKDHVPDGTYFFEFPRPIEITYKDGKMIKRVENGVEIDISDWN